MSSAGGPIVELRPYGAADEWLLQRLLGDPSMMVHLGGPQSPDAVHERHERYVAYDGSSEGVFTIVVGAQRAPAGWIGYWETPWEGELAWECGWHVLPEYQRRGVATAAVRLMLEAVRARGSHRFVHAFPSVGNTASNALCRRLGFELIGETDVEFPPGTMMRANDWRFEVASDGLKESFDDKLRRVLAEPIGIVDYDPAWPDVFCAEEARLLRYFPDGVIVRVEHIGSTAVPGLAAKPIIDILVGVTDVTVVRDLVAPRMEAAGYDYFWRPTSGNDVGPFYPWFIGRDAEGARISHVHVVEMNNIEQWDRVLFRDYLRDHPEAAEEYAALKRTLADRFGDDREAYTEEKTAFISRITHCAKREYMG